MRHPGNEMEGRGRHDADAQGERADRFLAHVAMLASKNCPPDHHRRSRFLASCWPGIVVSAPPRAERE